MTVIAEFNGDKLFLLLEIVIRFTIPGPDMALISRVIKNRNNGKLLAIMI